MFGSDKHAAAAGLARRVAALKEELDQVHDALWRRESGWERMASNAHDWISDHAAALPLPRFASHRRRLPLPDHPVPVVLAALAVGVGVGCVLYALTSSCAGKRPAAVSAQGGARRPASRVEE